MKVTYKAATDRLYIHLGMALNDDIGARLVDIDSKKFNQPYYDLVSFKPTVNNMVIVKNNFPEANWDDVSTEIYMKAMAEEQLRRAMERGEIQVNLSDLDDVPFARPLFDHQKKALLLGRDLRNFAYLMEQGTGKTQVVLDDIAHNFRMKRIDFVLIVCPNSVKSNWVDNFSDDDEVTKSMAPDIKWEKYAYKKGPNVFEEKQFRKIKNSENDEDVLKIMVAHVEMFSRGIPGEIQYYLKNHKSMIVVDESSRIKTHDSGRTKNLIALRAHADYARILTGTPIAKSPLNAYSQFLFLDRNIMGYSNWTAFKARYSEPGDKYPGQIAKYKNVDELSAKIAGSSFRITKDKCLDLPPKIYVQRKVKMSQKQLLNYHHMRDKMIVWLDNLHKVEATNVLTVMARLQQITSGYLPQINSLTGEVEGVVAFEEQPKMDEAFSILDETSGKTIVWCRYIFEIKEMSRRLRKEGIDHVLFHGKMIPEERTVARRRFETDDNCRVFVGQIQTGGIGLTLNAANTVIYLSNTFSTEDRLQSEDRNHRIGQDSPVTYYDLVCPATVDVRILAVMRDNKHMSDEVLKDGWRKWI